MLDTESQWSETLASNNISAIIRWLEKLTAEGDAAVEDILPTFSLWVQRTSEFAKKELLTLCFSRCQGLWMFVDRSSFTRVHMLLQRLRNLLTLAQWARRQLRSAHLWHGVGVPCMICTHGSTDVRRGCWNREHRALKQHIWLGRLVQWWGITGLLPKFPESEGVKRIAQMWKEMDHSHRKARLETPEWEEGEMGRFSSLIQGMVTQVVRQHGCIWISEDCTDQRYPPPDLQALLKLVLVPCIDNISVQAILMYFILDVVNFLQCKDDLLQSFCHAFTIPSSFSQQIRAFWMFDHGHIKGSMELLLSPRATVPGFSWQHRCIIHCLLTRKQPRVALRYLQWTRPAIESAEDAKLCADVLLQSSCVSDAWALLKTCHTQSEAMVTYFLHACNRYKDETDYSGVETTRFPLMKKDYFAERPPCPLSAKLYQAQKVSTVSSEELVKLLRKAVMEVTKPHPKRSELVWPKHIEKKSDSREMLLSTQALRNLTPSPSPMDMVEETEQTAYTDDAVEEQPVIHNQCETQEHISSSEDLSSVSASSFASASPLPLLKGDHPYVYERTLTLQRISSLLTDGEHQSREEEEEESRTPSSTDAFPDCCEMMLTPDGVIDPDSLSVNKDSLVELMFSAEDTEESVFLREDYSRDDALSGPSMDEKLLDTSYRLTLHSQFCSHKDGQSVPEFLSPDTEKRVSCKAVSEDIVHGPLWRSSLSLNQEDQPDCIPSRIFSFGEAAAPDCFLEKKQETCAHHQQEERVGCFNQDFSCTTSETPQDLLTGLNQSFDLKKPTPSSSPRMDEQDSSLLSPECCCIYFTHLKVAGSSLTTSPNCNIKVTSSPAETTNESSPKSKLKTGEPCTPAWPDQVGSWWKQDAETHRASCGLLSASEPGAAITSDNKRPSFGLNQPYAYSLVNCMDFTTKQKGDKQAENEDSAGWSSLGMASQGAIRSGRTRSRKGKRVKRT